MEAVLGVVMTLFIGLFIAIPVGMFVRRKIWIGILFNGVVWGLCVGGIVYSVVLMTLGWENSVGLVFITIISSIAGAFMSFEYGPQMVLYGTSFVGSYMFMRGMTLIFDRKWKGFP